MFCYSVVTKTRSVFVVTNLSGLQKREAVKRKAEIRDFGVLGFGDEDVSGGKISVNYFLRFEIFHAFAGIAVREEAISIWCHHL